MEQKIKEKDSTAIKVHNELIEILEDLRKKLSVHTYGALDSNVSYRDLTLLLAKKIKKIGGIR